MKNLEFMKKIIFSILLMVVAVCSANVVSAQVNRPQVNPAKKTVPYTFDQNRVGSLNLNSVSSGPIQCIDTILYPQSKTTALEIDTLYFGYVEGVSEAYYLTSNGFIHGIRAMILLDTNATAGDVPSLNMIIKVSNIDALKRPTTLIASNTVSVSDIGFQEQTFLFAAPVAVSTDFTVSIELDPAIPLRGAWYATNSSVAADGNDEQLAATLFAGIWYNFQAQFLPPWDIDHLVAPIFEQTINSTYTVSTDSICVGDSIVFTNTSTLNTVDTMFTFNNVSIPLYQWDYNDGTGIYTHFDTTYTFNAGGTYNTQLLITSYGYTGNCVDSSQQTIEVFEPIVVASSDTIICTGGDVVNLTVTGATTYSWDNGLGAGQNQSFVPTLDTSYVVTGTVALGCLDTDTVFVAIAPCNCVDTILYPQTKITSFEVDTLYFGYVEGVAQAYYLTNNGLLYGVRARVLLDTNTTSNDVAPLDMILKVSNIDALKRPTTVIASNTVTVNDIGRQAQTFLFTTPVAVSTDFTVSIELDPSIPNRGAWYVTNNSILADGNDEQLAATLFAGIWYNFQAQFLPPYDIDNLVAPIFDQTITSSYTTSTDSICAGDSVIFTNTSTLNTVDTMFTFNGSSTPLYQWDYNDGTGIYTHFDTTYTFNTGGTYNTQLLITSYGYTGNCVDSSQQTIEVVALPVVVASIDTAICLGDTVFLSATGATTYSWDNGLGLGQNQIATPIINTTYIVTGTVALGCADVDTVDVTINPLPTIVASNDTTVCLGDTVFLSANGATTYLWDNGLGAGQNQTDNPIINTVYIVTGTDVNGCSNTDLVNVTINALPTVVASNDTTVCEGESATISATGGTIYTWDNGLGAGQSHVVTPVLLTTYIVSVSDVNGCIGSDSVIVTVNTLPVLVTNSDTSLCQGDSIILFATGATTYLWDNGLGIGQTHLLVTPLDTTYIVVGLDANGCSNTDSVVVTVISLPNIVASSDTAICLGTSAIISASGATLLTWDNGLGVGQSFVVSPTVQTTYIVIGDESGCIESDTVVISIDNLNCFNIPNVFTPNGDGKNDLWNIRGLDLYPDLVVQVFNRWGDLMFESASGYPEAWDGTYNGTPAPSATYYYIIVLGGGEEGITGTINIIR
ncbi:MAG: hypothetical protein COA97_06620 [Flavobacteriales bacterium]|nr:MAG: hypothetical protein COA97_06620 [Flavobacteriales bacterium]